MVIRKGFDKTVEQNDIVQFSIYPFRNPISTAQREGFLITVIDANEGEVTEGGATLQITEGAKVMSDSVEIKVHENADSRSSNYLINELVMYKLEVQLPVGLEPGCQVEIILPEELEFGPTLQTVSTGFMFGTPAKRMFSPMPENHSIFMRDVCDTWLSNN